MRRVLSLAYMTVAELSPPDAVRAAHAAGYDSVDLRLQPVAPGDRSYDLSPSSPVLRDTLSCLAETGMSVFDIEQIRLTRELDVSALGPLFDAAARLGARRIKVAGADPDLSVVIERMAQVCECVDPLGITVDLEFMMFSSVRTLQDADRVTAGTNCRNAGILIDALHLSRSGGAPADIGAIDPARFGYVHLCDAPAALPPNTAAMLDEARTERAFPGDGELPLVALLRALPPDLPVSVELAMLNHGYDAATRARLGAIAARRVIAAADGALSLKP